MSSSQQKPWSDDPNAPKIPYGLYFDEKVNLAGHFITSILYGILIVLSFRCMAALLDPVHRRGEPIKWGLVSYTIIMLSLVTVEIAVILDGQSTSYVDNRNFSGNGGLVPPGPIGYQVLIYREAVTIVPWVMFLLNNWLADGLLLYRCYVIYSTNLWVVAFPCLMYLSSLAMGTMVVYEYAKLAGPTQFSTLPYFLISLSLNVFLTLTIVIRLTLHTRNTRTALGTTRSGGTYKSIVTVLVESSALYTVSSLLVIGPWATGNYTASTFFLILAQTQVIAPLLIIQRVANKNAWAGNPVVPARAGLLKAGSQRQLTGGSCVLLGEGPMSSMNELGVNPSGRMAKVEAAVDFHRSV